jgi:DNA mismatch repair protein MutS2
MKLTVSAAEVRTASEPVARAASPDRPARTRSHDESPSLETPVQTRDNTCDVRGLYVDDAVPFAMSFLDRTLHEGVRVAFILHGHGTGALRDAIRRELRQSGYVARFRPGDANEGGDGVTVVWLA